ncbi:MAG: DNA polymerase III subunit alpha [Armatimonadetes bacterium]|nr:DNA polymerase III subunit alpha [Armatimonadota bacterium]
MRSDGVEILAKWRETGAWWSGETPLEWVEYRDKRGVRRQKSRPLGTVSSRPLGREYKDDSTEEVTIIPRKLRDEKVSRACGYVDPAPVVHRPGAGATYAPLHVLSGYSFGRSLLFARELARRAADMGLPALALTDRFSLAGAVEHCRESRDCGVKPIVGTTVEMECGGELVLLARDKRGYASLSRLITECHLGQPRLFPLCDWHLLEKHSQGLICLTGGHRGVVNHLVASRQFDDASAVVDRLAGVYGRESLVVEIERSFVPWERMVNGYLIEAAAEYGITACAGGQVTHATADQFPAQDVLVCAETLCRVEELVGRKPTRHESQPQGKQLPLRAMNAESMLRSPAAASALFHDAPELLANTLLVADRIDDDVLPGRTRMPSVKGHPSSEFATIVQSEARLVHGTMDKQLTKRLKWETERIMRLGYADHFLVMWDACRWARENGVLHSGRGSVVDSAVAYCLGLSRIDAYEHDLHFDRFLPEDGSKRPDIDIDFEARRRDDIRNYLVEQYGKDHVATVAAFGAYCTRGIVREVGKALGIDNETIGFLSKRIHRSVQPDQMASALDKRPELRKSGLDRQRLEWLFKLAAHLMDVPRNARAHSSGVVVSAEPICETVPVMWSGSEQSDGWETTHLRIMQWDKRSAKYYFDKFDILCLRGQDVLSGTQRRVRQSSPEFDVRDISLKDPETYRVFRSGELIGVPQSASPAMRQAHIRVRTQNLHDASLVQAGIRPGVGGAVKINELIARRRGLKPFTYEHPDFEPILGMTYGIIVFQEQVDQLLQTFCGYTSGEAEDIRDAIHKRRKEDYGQVIRDELLAKCLARGYGETVAQHVFELVAAFKGYGFAHGHALAFGEISVRSVFCQQNFPAEYFASLLDAQPAGYYGPCTLVNEARSRGVAVLPVCAQKSDACYLVEDVKSLQDPQVVLPNAGIRVGLNQIKGLSNNLVNRMVTSRRDGFEDLLDFVKRTKPNQDELERLVLCGALDRLEPNRRAAMCSVPQLLSAAADKEQRLGKEWKVDQVVKDFNQAEKAVFERQVLELDIERHLMTYEREKARSKGAITVAEVKALREGERAVVVGNPIRLRFPPTPSGKRVVFFDLEDETGLLNVTCFDRVYQMDGQNLVCSPYITVVGTTQDRDGHMAFLARRIFVYQPAISQMVDSVDECPVKFADYLVS